MRITGYRSLATAREWGRPVGDEGARYELPPHRTLWRSDSVAEQGVSDTEMPAPLPGFVEQVYEHALSPTRRAWPGPVWSTNASAPTSSWSSTRPGSGWDTWTDRALRGRADTGVRRVKDRAGPPCARAR
ncbi:hypothetical protein [Streptomyces sp. NPDC021139]|uniref:hypothetical protein n=1 Tax=unclassified Streptomyces TaxID=2593676 RepID=UPI0033C3FF7A